MVWIACSGISFNFIELYTLTGDAERKWVNVIVGAHVQYKFHFGATKYIHIWLRFLNWLKLYLHIKLYYTVYRYTDYIAAK